MDNTNFIIDPIGMSGVKIGANFHIITGDRNAIKNIKRCVDRSNLQSKDLVLQPLASAAAVMTEEDFEAGVAIVDIGGGTTDMAVFHDGMLKHTAVIPFAGVNITNDIRLGLGVLKAQAEQMKVQFGKALADEANASAYITIPGLRGLPAKEISVKNLANIIQARMEEILEHVLFHLKQLDLDKKLHGGIILTGGGAQLQNLVQLTEYRLGIGARLGFPNEHLAGGHANDLMNPMYSTCIGLILRGYYDIESGRFKSEEFNSSYIHAEIKEVIGDSKKEPIEIKTEEETAEEILEKTQKRTNKMKQLFENLKWKFVELFEEEDDQVI